MPDVTIGPALFGTRSPNKPVLGRRLQVGSEMSRALSKGPKEKEAG